MGAVLKTASAGIMLLVTIAAWGGAWAAGGGVDALGAVLGAGLMAGAASVLNNIYDRDIDALMGRTKGRPLVTGETTPAAAGALAAVMIVLGTALILFWGTPLAAVLAGASLVLYVCGYTMLLKRRTPYAAEIGGFSGALPPLIGWAAVTGGISEDALIMFLIIVLWQPPHFWALAERYADDYRRAGIPVLPVVHSVRYVRVRSLLYIFLTVLVSFLPFFSGRFSAWYGIFAAVLGAGYIVLGAMAALGKRGFERALFYASMGYLGLLFTALALGARGV